jgi:hypothetical protein
MCATPRSGGLLQTAALGDKIPQISPNLCRYMTARKFTPKVDEFDDLTGVEAGVVKPWTKITNLFIILLISPFLDNILFVTKNKEEL